MIATVKDSISIRISAQGYASEIRSISVNNPTMTILLKPKDIILDDVFVRSDASNNGIRTRSLENVQVAAIFEGKKSELINVNELLSNKSTDKIIPTLKAFSEYDTELKAVTEKLINTTGYNQDKAGLGIKGKQFLKGFYKAFEVTPVVYDTVKLTTDSETNAPVIKVYSLNKSNVGKHILERWSNSYRAKSIKYDNLLVSQLSYISSL